MNRELQDVIVGARACINENKIMEIIIFTCKPEVIQSLAGFSQEIASL